MCRPKQGINGRLNSYLLLDPVLDEKMDFFTSYTN